MPDTPLIERPEEDDDDDPALDAGLRAAFDTPPAPGDSVLDRLEARMGGRPSVLLPSGGGGPILRPAAGKASSAGKRVGRYDILGEVARGGMGVILKGRDVDLGRDVALKVLKDQYVDQGELIQRFVEEAQIAGQLQHPGIVPVYELGIDDDQRPFFTMKLIEGKTLSRLLADRPDPTADRMRHLRVFEAVCDALGYAHSRGVVHRDLKPANILVGAFGEVQVVDWGFAKVLPQGGVADEESALRDARDAEFVATVRSGPDGIESHYGAVIGTPSYMPPEQARGEVDGIDERSDVFALGAILCEILTGLPAFVGASIPALMQLSTEADLSGAFERLDACDADPPLVALARSCLAAERLERPRDAGYLALALAEYLASIETRAREAEVRAARAAASAQAERHSRRLTLVLAATVLAGVCVGVLGWSWSAGRERTRVAGIEDKIERTLRDASGHAGSGDWAQALTALEQGDLLAAEEGVSPTLLDSLNKELAAARSALDDQAFAARLEAVRSSLDADLGLEDEEYAQAFAEHGLDLDGATPEDVAARVGRGTGLALHVAFALDDWVWRTWPFRPTSVADADRLVEIARHLDLDVWRNELRSAALALDVEALRELEGNADFEGLPPHSLHVLGKGLLLSGDRDLAVSVLERAVAEHPGDFHLNIGLAMILWRGDGELEEDGETASNDRQRAERHARIAVALRPEHAGPRTLLAGIQVAEGDPEAASKSLDEAEERGADPIRLRMLRGEVLRAQKDYAGELALAEEMLAQRPGFPPALWMRIDALIELGRKDEVRAALESLVTASPGRRGGRGPGMGGPGGPGRRRGGGGPQRRPETDGADAIGPDEVPERLRPWFDVLDRNGDGVLTGDEARVLHMERRRRHR